MNATVSALLWCVLQVTVLACGATGVYLAVRRSHPRAGVVAVSGGLLLALVLTALVASPWPRWTFFTGSQAAATNAPAVTPAAPATGLNSLAVQELSRNARDVPPSDVDLDSPQRAFWTAMVDALNNPQTAVGTTKPQAARWPPAVGVLFVGGMLLAAVRLLCGVVMVSRLARRAKVIDDTCPAAILSKLQQRLGSSQPIALRESGELATPATVGWRRPVILLPAAWRTWRVEELRAAIAHELAHVAGRDYAAWLMARIAVVAHFYHPLIRWLASRLQLEQELAADMSAAHLLGDGQRYLHSLAALALATPPTRLAGPARTLFPSRSQLVRRVEMLRTLGTNRPRPRAARYATFALIALIALAAAGLRGPGSESGGSAQAQPPADKSQQAGPTERIGLELVPHDVTFVVSVRPAEIAERKEFAELAGTLDEKLRPLKLTELTVRDLREIMIIKYGELNQRTKTRFVARFVAPRHQQQFLEHVKAHGFKKVPDSNAWTDAGERFVENDASTLVYDYIEGIEPAALAPLQNPLPRWAELWRARSDQPIVAIADATTLRRLADANALVGGVPLQMIAPLMHETDWAVAGVELKGHLHFSGIVRCNSEESAKRVHGTLQALSVLLQNMIHQQMAAIEARPAGADEFTRRQRTIDRQVAVIAREIAKMMAAGSFNVDHDRVQFSFRSEATMPEIARMATTFFALLPTVEEARRAGDRATSMNNLKRLALAMHQYHDAHKSFPPALSYTYRKDGQELKSEHPHSWRVAILPFLEQQALYNHYHFDEPWDSEANKKWANTVVPVFQSPNDDPSSTNTSYFVLTGPETIFHDEEGASVMEITDGTARTILLVEAKRPVPWTKPEDIRYAADQPVPKLGGWVPGEFLVALADGSWGRISTDVDETTLRAWITKAGGERAPDIPPFPRGN